MILKGIKKRVFHEGIGKGLISLILKEGIKGILTIGGQLLFLLLFTTFFLSLANKTSTHFNDIISLDQANFHPLSFILNNVVLTQEFFHSAKASNRPIVFLKLDFSKAYHKVS